MEEADPAMLSLFPVTSALSSLVSAMASLRLAQVSAENIVRNHRPSQGFLLTMSYLLQTLPQSTQTLQSLTAELEHVARTSELDFSSVQHIASWIDAALEHLPTAASSLAAHARVVLAPLRSSLTLTSGKEMTSLWKSSLPFQSPSSLIVEAYARLLSRAESSQGEVWDKGKHLFWSTKIFCTRSLMHLSLFEAAVGLFLDIAITLGVPQHETDASSESAAADLVEMILKVGCFLFACGAASVLIPKSSSVYRSLWKNRLKMQALD